MPTQHAKLSPSSAERWISCPASVLATEGIIEEESPYAREGTAAHGLAEIKASLAFGLIDAKQYKRKRAAWVKEFAEYAEHDDTLAEMERHTDAYVELLRERLAVYDNSTLMLEQRLPTGLPDDGAGTSDAVIVSPQHVEIVDFKYGAGVAVEAEGNPQLRLYAGGALDTYGDLLGNTEAVLMTVHQPRMDHVLTAELTPDALREWRTSILPVAAEALEPGARFGPSEAACRWCPLSGRCRAQVEAAFPDDLEETDPATLSPVEVSEYLAKLPQLKDWLKAFEEAALTMAYSEGVQIPGYKVVRSGGKRVITDGEKAIEVLRGMGYDIDEVSARKVRGIGELEKLLGKDTFAEVLEPYLTKTEGREALAPLSDKRPSITPNAEAANTFDEIDD